LRDVGHLRLVKFGEVFGFDHFSFYHDSALAQNPPRASRGGANNGWDFTTQLPSEGRRSAPIPLEPPSSAAYLAPNPAPRTTQGATLC